MVSTELIRRFPVFAGLSHDNMVKVASAGELLEYPEEHMFFRTGDVMDTLYVCVEGTIKICLQATAGDVRHGVADQLTGNVATESVVVSTVTNGEVFGWSSLVTPHEATSMVSAATPVKVVEFDANELRRVFEEDYSLGYDIAIRLIRVVSQRLRDMRIESLSHIYHSDKA
jgi:CRP-like cAMP-binding protein